jgi:hypothetical protein
MNAPRTRRDTLIAEVTRILDAPPTKRDECRNQVIRYIESAKARKEWNRKSVQQPGVIKRKAAVLRDCLAKAKIILREIEPFFSSVFDDTIDYDVSRSYAAFQKCLTDAIAASEGIERQIVVPKGKKPKNYHKYEAKSLAMSLFNEFSVADDERLQNDVASILYELLTGTPDVDIPESVADLRSPFLKTRGRIKT